MPPFSIDHSPANEAFDPGQSQIWSNRTDEMWRDPAPHHHTASDGVFIVLTGAIIVEVNDKVYLDKDERRTDRKEQDRP